MAAVYLLFLRRMIKSAATGIPIAVMFILVLDRFAVPYADFIQMMPIFVGYALLIVPSVLIRKNLSWFMALPISKRGVLLLEYVIGMTGVFLFALSACLTVALVYLIKTGTVQLGPDPFMCEELIEGFKKIKAQGHMPVQIWAFLVAAVTVFNSIMLHLSVVNAAQGTVSKPLYVRDPKREKRTILGFVGICAASYLFRDYILTGWAAFVIVTLAFCVLGTHGTVHTLGVFGREKNRWLTVAWIIACAELGGIYGVAWSSLKTGSPIIAAESIQFLGPWSGRARDEWAARLLTSDISKKEIAEVKKIYNREILDGGVDGHPVKDLPVTLRDAVRSKTNLDALTALLGLYDPESLMVDDLHALFRRVAEISEGTVFHQGIYRLLDVRLTREEVFRFLESDDLSAVCYGLLRPRYERDASYVPVILKNIGRYGERQKIMALETLSILYGRRIGIDDYAEFKRTGRLSGSFYTPSCKTRPAASLSDFLRSDEGWLNVCARVGTSAMTPKSRQILRMELLEIRGWIDIPMDESARRTVAPALGYSGD